RRERRSIVLTEAGGVYQAEISGALQRISSASLQAIASRSGGGNLHLAALPTFAAKWLMPRLNGFYAQHPDTLIHVHSRIGLFDLERAGMDAVIGVGDSSRPGLVAQQLLEEEVVPVISPAVARTLPVNYPADMGGHLLLQVTARPAVWQQWFRDNHVPPS